MEVAVAKPRAWTNDTREHARQAVNGRELSRSLEVDANADIVKALVKRLGV